MGAPGALLARIAAVAAISGTGVFGKECRIGLLQWNIHGECFRHCSNWHDHHCDRQYPRCNREAPAFLHSELQDESMDFAAVEQLENAEFLMHGMQKDAWGKVQHACGGKRGFGQWPFDIAVLFFNRRRWKELPSGRRGGCMEKIWKAPVANYRAYVVQSFQRTDGSDEKVIVVAAHYPHHHAGVINLITDIRMLQKESGAHRLILMADTNRPGDYSSVAIMHQIYPAADGVSSATLHHTCCFPHFHFMVDRIIAAGFPGAKHPMETRLPFRAHWGSHSPPWAAINMHDPVRGHLAYWCDGNASTPQLV